MQCRLWVCLHSMRSGRSVDPVVYDTLPKCYSKPRTQHYYCWTNFEVENKWYTEDASFPNFWPRMRVQPMVCAPRKARLLLRLWSEHGWVLFFSVRGACDRWCKYYNGWLYILYRELQEGKAMWECSLCVKYVYTTAPTAVLFQRHTQREDTTYSN